ncbi:GAF and ANTAR domain-containing protein [Microlunatus flavus]|uniref:GAF domain-containing protein n=1 Tax=Microlunatus flavus TaxID=1036181 RepID=A0A1H9CA50_9ACTN|nr:GAF and ANTAR domain-containing protein [Microlunatus flavus]SEP97861.1 GAF domain-containing protein [Microlunatus flavus]
MVAVTSGQAPARGPYGVSSPEVLTLVEDYLSETAGRAHHRLGDVLGVALTTAVAGGDPMTTGSSTERAAKIDQTQYAIGLGPCLLALSGAGELYVPDLASDPRWGDYGPAAAELGARSCISVPVTDGDERVIGVLKVYSAAVDGLDATQRDTARRVALAMAGSLGLASALMATSSELQDRIEAMDARRTIDLATGVLMGRLGLSADAAFEALRRESQNANVKLREVAAGLLSVTSPDGDGKDAADASGSNARAPFSRRGDVPVAGR